VFTRLCLMSESEGVLCMYVCKDSAAPAHARTRAHRPAAFFYHIYIYRDRENITVFCSRLYCFHIKQWCLIITTAVI